jgi:hypothetical protein
LGACRIRVLLLLGFEPYKVDEDLSLPPPSSCGLSPHPTFPLPPSLSARSSFSAYLRKSYFITDDPDGKGFSRIAMISPSYFITTPLWRCSHSCDYEYCARLDHEEVGKMMAVYFDYFGSVCSVRFVASQNSPSGAFS